MRNSRRAMAQQVVPEEDTSFPKPQEQALTAEEQLEKMRKEGEEPMLALPEKGEFNEENKKRVIEVGGEKVVLDELGPVVVNEDGSLSRITNWHEMTDIEQKNTLRIIGKRNQKRRAKLLEKEKETK